MTVPSKKNVFKWAAQIAVVVFVPGGLIGVMVYHYAKWRKRRNDARKSAQPPEQLKPSND